MKDASYTTAAFAVKAVLLYVLMLVDITLNSYGEYQVFTPLKSLSNEVGMYLMLVYVRAAPSPRPRHAPARFRRRCRVRDPVRHPIATAVPGLLPARSDSAHPSPAPLAPRRRRR